MWGRIQRSSATTTMESRDILRSISWPAGLLELFSVRCLVTLPSFNDIRMLTEMGWGVRMLNHKPQLSDVGKDSTKFSNDDDGVARYLEEHILASGAA
mmetsp:Transcript_86235/g.241195  ORF Transcript_86235/g.241195 Transcript_86235/m.241195 type:complete len:98 (-) Transcript_86235:107-400(-)